MKEARRLAGLTQQEVADMLGVSRSYVCKLEKKVEPLSIEMAVRLAHIYDVMPKDLF